MRAHAFSREHARREAKRRAAQERSWARRSGPVKRAVLTDAQRIAYEQRRPGSGPLPPAA